MKKTMRTAALAAGFTALIALASFGSGTAGQNPTPQAAPPGKNPSAQDPQSRIIVPVDRVNVVFTVVNRRGKFITDLERDEFKVFEDGEEREIRAFSRETDLPLRIGMLLDTSNSIRDRLQFEKDAAVDFLHNVLRRGKDQAFLMTFDAEPAVLQSFTDDINPLQERILKLRAGGGTALYDSVHFACDSQLANAPLPKGENPEVRRVLVIISDGDDNQSHHARSEAIDAAQRAGAAVYAISTNTEWVSTTAAGKKYHFTEGDKVLGQFAEETGGRAFFPYRVEDLEQSFLDIGNELRSQYSLAFKPGGAADGKFHRIKIEVARKGLTARARKGYYMPKPATTATSGGVGSNEQR